MRYDIESGESQRSMIDKAAPDRVSSERYPCSAIRPQVVIPLTIAALEMESDDAWAVWAASHPQNAL